MLITAPVWAAATAHPQIRTKAQNAYNNGNWKDAFELYRKLCLETENDPRMVGQDFTQAWQCLRRLNRLQELDTVSRRGDSSAQSANWRLLRDTARSYSQNAHWGYRVAGEFQRGSHRGGGKYVNAIARDRVRALQLMHQAMKPAEVDPLKSETAQFYVEFARMMLQFRGSNQAWRLQYLTDLSQLPDYELGYGYEYNRQLPGSTGRC